MTRSYKVSEKVLEQRRAAAKRPRGRSKEENQRIMKTARIGKEGKAADELHGEFANY